MERGPGVAHQILKHGLVGKPDEIAEKLKEYVNAAYNLFPSSHLSLQSDRTSMLI